MPKTDPTIPLDDYAPVADRIELFYSKFPEGRITTKLLPRTNIEVVVKAFVYRQPSDTLPAATGLASERIGDGEINMYACLENTETSAIGRALANLGFAASRKRPSREEMEKVERARNGFAYRSPPLKSQSAKPSPERASTPVARLPLAVQQDLLVLMERAEILGFSSRRLGVIRERFVRGPEPSLDDSTRLEKGLRDWVMRHTRARTHR